MTNSRIRISTLITLLVLSLLTPIKSKSETTGSDFINITYLNGLTTNSIYDICTDKSGCLWIGTATGLSKYNGYNVQNFFKEEMYIRSNIIKYLMCDKRNRIWIGSGSGVGLYDNDTKKFLNLDLMTGDAVENKVAGLFEDSRGTIWVSLRSGAITAINPDTFSTSKHFTDAENENYFSRIWFEPENNLYLATKINGGLFYLDMTDDSEIAFSPAEDQKATPFAEKKITGLTKVNNRSLCLACEDGTLWIVNPYERTYSQLPMESKEQQSYKLRKVFAIGDETIAIGHNTGLLIYDLAKKKKVINKITKALEGQNVYCISGNLDTGLIIGTFKDGVIIQQESGFDFTTFRGNKKAKRPILKESGVTGFAETNDTTIWVTTRLKGLFRYSTTQRTIRRYDSPQLPKDLDGIVAFNGKLWLRSSSGIYCLNPLNGEIISYREGYQNNSNMLATKDGKLVVLADKRLLQFDESSDSFKVIKDFKDLTVLEIGQSESSTLAAVTEEKGLVRWANGKVTEINNKQVRETSLLKSPIVLLEDEESKIWSAPPESGILTFTDKEFNSITTRSGLASDIITNIIKDNNGNVFITTDRSLTKITRSGKMYSITKSDGLINFGFNRASAFLSSTGEIFLGSRDGITILHTPSKKRSSATIGTTDIAEKITCDGNEIPLKNKNKAVLKHNQNTIEITISDIDPYHIVSGKGLYCLEGHDNTWRPIGKDRKLSYQGLKPGTYTLKAYNPKLESMTIRVNSHPLTSVTAYIIYIVLMIALMTVIIIYIRGNEIRKRKEKTYQMKMDLHQEKLDFFTNIAHEIKTPLTLITTPLNHLTENPNLDADARFDIEVMNRHASYLSTLIRELLEFSKIEKNRFNICCKPIDLCSNASNVIANFTDLNSQLDWRVSVPDEPIWVMADTSATIKILNNLVFNAIKYTESFVEIDLTLSDDGFAEVRIANDGKVIPLEMRSKIFESFVRYDNGEKVSDGFGIGLSVAKTLAQRQEGELNMSDKEDINEFILRIPLTTAPAAQEEDDDVTDENFNESEDVLNETILVVEDHPDLLDYIKKNLSRKYRILTAENGVKALEIIRKQSNIDLVLTDLKMPKMSGLELCTKIKNDPTFSHILTVILSANLTPETKVESMKIGVDALVEKPFSMEFLTSRIENLITSRKKMIQMISGNVDYEHNEEADSNIGLSSRDVLFLQELNRTIESNFSNPDFGVEDIAALLNISRSSLNRKMRDILNTTANNYIRDKRIEKAEELLRTSSMQVNEICYKVGFTTPSYFIKCFRKKYGMSPNEYANSSH